MGAGVGKNKTRLGMTSMQKRWPSWRQSCAPWRSRRTLSKQRWKLQTGQSGSGRKQKLGLLRGRRKKHGNEHSRSKMLRQKRSARPKHGTLSAKRHSSHAATLRSIQAFDRHLPLHFLSTLDAPLGNEQKRLPGSENRPRQRQPQRQPRQRSKHVPRNEPESELKPRAGGQRSGWQAHSTDGKEVMHAKPQKLHVPGGEDNSNNNNNNNTITTAAKIRHRVGASLG